MPIVRSGINYSAAAPPSLLVLPTPRPPSETPRTHVKFVSQVLLPVSGCVWTANHHTSTLVMVSERDMGVHVCVHWYHWHECVCHNSPTDSVQSNDVSTSVRHPLMTLALPSSPPSSLATVVMVEMLAWVIYLPRIEHGIPYR